MIGAKCTMIVLLVCQSGFNLQGNSTPPLVLTFESYLDYTLKNFPLFSYSLIVIFASFLGWIYLI